MEIKEKHKLDDVIARLDKEIDAYNEKLRELAERDILIAILQKQLGKWPQTSKRPVAQIVAFPTHPPSTKPIIEILGTPRTLEYYTHDELKEEMNKLKATQIKVAINFENKLRDIVMYLIDRVDWPTFYIDISKFSDILKKLRDNELAIRKILDRWIKRK